MKFSAPATRAFMTVAAVMCLHFPVSAAETLNATDAKFLQSTAQGGYFGLQASELADTHADDSGLKKYAALTIEDNRRIGKTLMTLAAEKNVKLPTGPSADQQTQLKQLAGLKGRDFDIAYLKHVGGSFQFERLESYKRTAERSVDVDVRGFARTVLATVNAHYAMANTLAKNVAPETIYPSNDTAPRR